MQVAESAADRSLCADVNRTIRFLKNLLVIMEKEDDNQSSSGGENEQKTESRGKMLQRHKREVKVTYHLLRFFVMLPYQWLILGTKTKNRCATSCCTEE